MSPLRATLVKVEPERDRRGRVELVLEISQLVVSAVSVECHQLDILLGSSLVLGRGAIGLSGGYDGAYEGDDRT